MAEAVLSPHQPPDHHRESTSPPPNCAICLGTCQNKCFSDSCMHEFCFKCLLEWSKIKAECPLCKQTFRSIIHNIKSLDEYDQHVVENNITHEENPYIESTSVIYLPPARPPALHQYHFRTTFTVDTHGEHAIQQMLLSHPLLTIGNFTPDRYTHHRRRRGDTSATTFRRSIYSQNLWAHSPPDVTGRYRDVSPSFFRSNPSARTRLVPWLNRELNALLFENTQQVMHLVDIIMDHLLRHHICSFTFRSLLFEHLSTKTDHFIHEFYTFMRSPFDMIGYDRHVVYRERRPSPIPFIDEIDISGDSDVILVSDSNNPNGNHLATNNETVVIDLVETDSDEPIIVSEQAANRLGPIGASPTDDNTLEGGIEQRQPILPLKLRLKNRHKAKERQKAKRKHRKAAANSSSSSSTSSSSSSDTESSYKIYEQKRRLRKLKRKRREYYVEKVRNVSSGAENSENESHSNHTAKPKRPKRKVTDSLKRKYQNNKIKEEIKEEVKQENSSGNEKNKKAKQKSGGTSKDSSSSSSNSDDSFYISHRPPVKSRIKDPTKSEENKQQKAGPSSGRLRNTLKKEPSNNLWYSRPSIFDSDTSESN